MMGRRRFIVETTIAAGASLTGCATQKTSIAAKEDVMNSILTGVNYFAGWWTPMPNKWHRHASSFATEQGSDWRPDFPNRGPHDLFH